MLLIHVVTKKPLLRQLSPDINTISDLILEVQKCGFRTGDLMMALDGNLSAMATVYFVRSEVLCFIKQVESAAI